MLSPWRNPSAWKSTNSLIHNNCYQLEKSVQWKYFKNNGKETTNDTNSESLSLSFSQRAPKMWESSNIAHNSSLLSKILLHYDSILLQSQSVRKQGFSWQEKRVSAGIAFSVFPPDVKFLHVGQNQEVLEM